MQHRFKIYVPNPEASGSTTSVIARASAIVGTGEVREGRLTVWYEGNLYNAQNLRTYAERVLHASGRMAQRYPTVAFCSLPAEQLIEVGEGDLQAYRLRVITHPDALQSWLGDEPLPSGVPVDRQHELRRRRGTDPGATQLRSSTGQPRHAELVRVLEIPVRDWQVAAGDLAPEASTPWTLRVEVEPATGQLYVLVAPHGQANDGDALGLGLLIEINRGHPTVHAAAQIYGDNALTLGAVGEEVIVCADNSARRVTQEEFPFLGDVGWAYRSY